MFSNTTARPAMAHQLRRCGRRLEHRAVGSEVAAQHRDAAALRPAGVSSGRITSWFQIGASWQFSQMRLAVHRQRVAMQQAVLASSRITAGSPPA